MPRAPRLLLLACVLGACVSAATRPGTGSLHRWWSGFGPVLPHDGFPADCGLCHLPGRWDAIREDFSFDHEQRTGVPLPGAHAEAQCLRCHNDRGPVSLFNARGCGGCHDDVHQGDLGPNCSQCHQQRTWDPLRTTFAHGRGRFPLTAAHAAVSCHRCHPGARVGNFLPADTECVSCHADDVANTTNPPHVPLGWTDNCQRCHFPTRWEQATTSFDAARTAAPLRDGAVPEANAFAGSDARRRRR